MTSHENIILQTKKILKNVKSMSETSMADFKNKDHFANQ